MKVHFQIQNDLFTQKEEPFGETVKVMLIHLLLSFSMQNLLKNPYYGCKAEIWRPGLESTYRDSGNPIYFSSSTLQIFPPSQKITIPKYNAVSYS